MESRESSNSLLSQRLSEEGSDHLVESGIYMSSFAATILFATIAAAGVLLFSLVIALAVMLKSCQKTDKCVFEEELRTTDQCECCKFSAFLHAKLDRLEEAAERPTICKEQQLFQFFNESILLQDLKLAVEIEEGYFVFCCYYSSRDCLKSIEFASCFQKPTGSDASLLQLVSHEDKRSRDYIADPSD